MNKDGGITYTVAGGDFDAVKAGLEAYKGSPEYLMARDADHNMRQVLAMDIFLEDCEVAIELKRTQINGKGGFDLFQTLRALQVAFAEQSDVHVVSGHEVSQDSQLSIVLRAAMETHGEKRFFVFPYAVSQAHMIGVVVDRKLKQLRVCDHQESTRQASIKNPLLMTLTSTLGCDSPIDGYQQSPYKSQENDWECSVLAVLSIKDDVARHQHGTVYKGDKDHPDLAKEADRILRTSRYLTQEEKQEQALSTIYQLWRDSFPTTAPQNWIEEKFKSLAVGAVNISERADLRHYLKTLQNETNFKDFVKSIAIRGFIENMGSESLEEMENS
ncbi:MAG: hypothetical protein IPP74_00095 [Alphaproteobacteria bacterium]|nr:hypothetical protein [Alphaproteobacteria bacterium]